MYIFLNLHENIYSEYSEVPLSKVLLMSTYKMCSQRNKTNIDSFVSQLGGHALVPFHQQALIIYHLKNFDTKTMMQMVTTATEGQKNTHTYRQTNRTRIRQKAVSHLVGQKSQKPQSECGY